MVSGGSRSLTPLALEEQDGLGLDRRLGVGLGSFSTVRAGRGFAWWGPLGTDNVLCALRLDKQRGRPLLWVWLGKPITRDGGAVCPAVASGVGRRVGIEVARVQDHARGGPY